MRRGPVGAYAPVKDAVRLSYFAELLVEFRTRRNVSQRQLALRIGMSSGYISRLEHEARYPSGDVVEDIITALHLRHVQANALRMAAGFAPRQKTGA